MDKGKQAFRSGAALSLPPEELDQDPQTDLDNEQDELNARYASLKGHAGWELIKQDFEKTIAAYRSGKAVATAIQQGKSNDEVGGLVRTSNAIADELEKIILTVEGAALALEEDGKPGKRAV